MANNNSKEKEYFNTLESKIKEKLYVGLELKNYRELCRLLDEPIKNGSNSKEAQFRYWKCFFDYEINNNKFIITRIYDEPKEKVDGRGKSEGSRSNNSKYIEHIENLLLDLLTKNNNKIICTRNRLLEPLGFVNEKYNYKDNKDIEKSLHKKYGKFNVDAFYKRTSNITKNILESALDSMQNRDIIQYRKRIKYHKNNDVGLATESEEEIYNRIKQKVMIDMGTEEGKPDKYENEWKIHLYSQQEKFYKKVNRKAHDELGWTKTYICYEIIYLHDGKPTLTTEQLQEERKILNSKVVKSIDTNATTQYFNQLDKYDKDTNEFLEKYFREEEVKDLKIFNPPDDYIEKQELLCRELIIINILETE